MPNLRSLRNGGHYVYRMPKDLYDNIVKELNEDKDKNSYTMSIEQYVTRTFGLLGKCVKVETF